MGLKPTAFLCWVLFLILSQNASVTAQTCNHDRWNKDYLYSKEVLFDGSHLFWGPRPPTAPSSYLKHWQAVPNDGRLVMYLRNVAVDDQGPQYNPDRLQALQFSGQQDSYATVPDTTGSGESVRADSYFTWFFEVKPAAGGSGEGVLLEYSDCYGPLRVMQVNQADLLVSVGDNLGQTHTVQASGVLNTSNWTRLAVSYKFDEPDLKIINFERSFEEPNETLLPICEVDRSRRLNATGDVRIGASFDPTLPSFSGSLGCVQFFPGYMLKNYESVPEFCDPALSRDDSLTVVEYMKDEDPNNLILPRQCSNDDMTTEGPTAETPTTNIPIAITATTDIPTTITSATETPSMETPTTEIPTTITSATETPSMETPTTEIPTTIMLTTETPLTENPSTIIAPTTELPGTEIPTVELSTTEYLATESILLTAQVSQVGRFTTAPSYLAEPEERCGSFQRLLTGVALDVTLPVLWTAPAQNVGSCAQACFNTPSCSAIGFDGSQCYLTTADSVSSAAFSSSGAFEFFSLG